MIAGLIGKLHLSSAEGGVEKRTDDGYDTFYYSHDSTPKLNPETDDYKRWIVEEKKQDLKKLFEPVNNFCCDGVPEEFHQTTWCTEMAIKFINKKRKGPWMLSINPFDPHPPFDPPKEYRMRYNPDDLPGPLFKLNDIERQKKFQEVCQQAVDAVNPGGENPPPPPVGGYKNPGNWPPESFNGKIVKAHYYAMIELLDKHFGILVNHLKEIGQLENTLIIFHSDHGEMLGDHGLIYKGSRFFEGIGSCTINILMAWKD